MFVDLDRFEIKILITILEQYIENYDNKVVPKELLEILTKIRKSHIY